MGLSAETADKERKVFVLELLDEGAAICENGRIWCWPGAFAAEGDPVGLWPAWSLIWWCWM